MKLEHWPETGSWDGGHFVGATGEKVVVNYVYQQIAWEIANV